MKDEKKTMEKLKRSCELKGIYFNNFEDISPEKWWEYRQQDIIRGVPTFCYNIDNSKLIIRHALLVYFKLDKEGIKELKVSFFKNNKLFKFYCNFNGKLDCLQRCFPEFNYGYDDLIVNDITDDYAYYVINKHIEKENLSINDILDCKFNSVSNNKLKSVINHKFTSHVEAFTWFLKKKDVKHPKDNRLITEFDFKEKPMGFWSIRENRITATKKYCIDKGIEDVIRDTNKLKKWTFENFKQKHAHEVFKYKRYYGSQYEMLVDAFPSIKEDKILFDWEWQRWEDYSQEKMNSILRDVVFYRLNLNDPKKVSEKLRFLNMSRIFPKLNKYLIRCDFYKNYYEWAKSAFPEYSDKWTELDFNIHTALDGTIFDSSHEKEIYEFLNEKGINVNHVGTDIFGENVYKINNKKWYVPDFIINHNGTRYVIEYFGMYNKKDYPNNKMLTRYKNKTKEKISYYTAKEGNRFIPLFPEDLNNNYKGLIEKFAQHNIQITV